jgi:hypothetical protein
MTNPASEAEWCRAGQLDSEVEWTEVKEAALYECNAAMSHLVPISWRFYLPAYMRLSLSLFVAPKFDSTMLLHVLFHLTVPAEEDGYQLYRRENFEALNTDQHAAVRLFLEFVTEETLRVVETTNDYWDEYNKAKLALASYWHKDVSNT